MFHLAILLCATSAVFAVNDADIKDYPHQLSLMNRGNYICSASIISEKWAITAAHCLDEFGPSQLSVRAGSSNRDSGGKIHTVSEAIVHEKYEIVNNDYDVALLQVSTPFVFGSSIAVIALPGQGQESITGVQAVITGWGHTSEDGVTSTSLKQVSVPLTTTATCQAAFKDVNITARMICAGDLDEGMNTCQEDSAALMVINGQLIGITSLGDACGEPNMPVVYTKVSSLSSWITDTSGVNGAERQIITISPILMVMFYYVFMSNGGDLQGF